jgi:hypothetical protein
MIHNSNKRNVLRGPWWLYEDACLPFHLLALGQLQHEHSQGSASNDAYPVGCQIR